VVYGEGVCVVGMIESVGLSAEMEVGVTLSLALEVYTCTNYCSHLLADSNIPRDKSPSPSTGG
jgi:hypothetical protein